jgi:hypothetical protein
VNVYVVTLDSLSGEGGEPVAVFSTAEKADGYVARQSPWANQTYSVEPFTIDEFGW